MKPVARQEIIDYQTYEEQRAPFRQGLMSIKDQRRVHVGDFLTFLFENRDTVRYQVQEMMRAEKLVKEAEILHELETYNELLGGPGELGCTLLIEIDDPDERAVLLKKWMGLPEKIYLRLADGRQVFARFDPRQVGDEQLSSVQFLKFDTGSETPVAIGAEHPELTVEAELTQEQRETLSKDLKD